MTTKIYAQPTNKSIVSNADTSYFIPNTKEGWGIMLGFVNAIGEDSVNLEIVLFMEDSVNLLVGNLVGWVRNRELWPSVTRICKVKAGLHQYDLRVETNGSVWLRESTGAKLEDAQIILPLIVMYKN
jgi:hypothetical protein